jgi:hypothetical protein
MNDMSPLTAPSLPYAFPFSCKHDGGLTHTRLDESANDFFGAEDLLSQAYEDAVHVGVAARVFSPAAKAPHSPARAARGDRICRTPSEESDRRTVPPRAACDRRDGRLARR